ncbi:MAG: SCO family protein [Myxococcales bacterium]|nr:SCO family protein [Myxococcales bacterium]
MIAPLLTLVTLLAPAAPAPALPDDSIYQLHHGYTAATEKPLALDAFRGKRVVISMFYGTCPHVCPMLIQDIKRLVDAADADTRDQVEVILVSFDPEHDTPAGLRTLAAKHGLDADRYHFALGTPDQVRELAAVLGIRYRRQKDGSIGHTSVITVLDEQGRVVDAFEGAGAGVLRLLPALAPKGGG